MIAARNGRGVALCLASAAGFGVAPILAKLAYGDGVGVVPMLAGRFAVATGLLWLLVARYGGPRPSRRAVAGGLVLGAALYAPQSGLYFGSIQRMDASLAALVVYAYPAMVALAAAGLGRERLSGRMVAALTASSLGVALVLLGAGGGRADGLGIAFALGAAAGYGAYVLVSDAALRAAGPLRLAALVTGGAAIAYAGAGLAMGDLPLHLGLEGWGLVLALAVASTVIPIAALLGGIRHLGPSSASVLCTLEPVVTAAVALVAFGEHLGPVQLAGGALVLLAVAILQAAPRRRARARALAEAAPA